ncbi:MAG: hypothetical protein HN981_00085 [Candidatus Pacebacteria bacterium]|jgi:hypothetical protein|nr:hypothetical protein [Candidatus Paceibacterota bacterium]MBT4652134.1 hypothetical protein [Candidatus Paceibacterota bacterium]MBT6756672.1 hypothetical protein [Candidatus Paceibacterota bacterium]MBT6920783.1 hypothetical protein [Candidatus Paceibacterota bacterium]
MMNKSKSTIQNFLRGKEKLAPQNTQENRQPVMPDNVDSSSYEAQLEMSRVAPGMYKPVPETLLLEWMAISRPFRKRNKQFFTTVLVIALLLSLILFFSGQYLPIAMVFSVVFLNYVLAVVPPTEIKHSVTTFGMNVEGNLYYWQELGRFWFDKKYGSLTLHVETARFPGRLTLVLPKEKKKEVSDILSEVLLQQKPPLSTFEKIAKWMQEKFPLE